MLGKFSGLNLKGPYLSLEKEKEIFCVVFTYEGPTENRLGELGSLYKYHYYYYYYYYYYSVKWAREIRKFHVAVVQQRLRNVYTKKRIASAKLLFYYYKLIAFFAALVAVAVVVF